MSVTKSDQLGMPFGTACNQLRKAILFKAVTELEWNICYRCDMPIEDVDQLTIEHKEPWLHNDPALFWDLSNIAFSHARCNVPHRQGGGRFSARRNEEGLWLCLDCGEHKSIDDFSTYKRDGKPRNWCKLCRARRRAEGKGI